MIDPNDLLLEAASDVESNLGDYAPGSSRKPETAYLPEVALPGGATTIISAAQRFGELLGQTGRFYMRGGLPVRRVDDAGEPRLEPIRPAAFCSDVEGVSRVVRVVQTKDGEQVVPANCSESTARLLLESAALRAELPPITIVARCPVLIERGGQLVQVTDYDRESGILASGKPVPHVELPEALELLHGIVAEYRFATEGDKARALAAVITPALVFGDLLGGRAPFDLGEADDSQSGKGYRTKLTAGIYNCTPRMVTQRSGGVGSMQESFDAALVAGACCVSLDNFRGKLDAPWIESFATEDTYPARVPYAGTVAIDPRRIVVSITSNAAEVTTDFANRCSCTRILKQPADYRFKVYPEGDLLDHVRANQPRYLGAVFAVIREWHRLGKPMMPDCDHDFRRWARTLGYISERILGTVGLLEGHRAAQQRISSPGLNWLRDIAIAVHRADKGGDWLRAHHVLEIMASAGVDPGLTEGVDDHENWDKAVRKLGGRLSRQFKGDVVTLDNLVIERREVLDDQYRRAKEYAFSSEPRNTPQVTPQVKPVTPQVPQPLSTICAGGRTRTIESSEGVAGVPGCSGVSAWDEGIDPAEAGL